MNKLNKCVTSMHTIKQKLNVLNKKYDKRRKFLINHFEKNINDSTMQEYEVDNIVAKVSKSTSVIYLVDKMKKKLSKSLFNSITSKSYEIVDEQELIKILKEYNVPKERVKKCISIKRKVNEQKLSDLFEIGEVTLEQLSGCYKVVPSRTMVTVKEKK